MSKSYGPQAFEKEWIKRLNKFNETKIFFFHDKSKTTIKYIDGDELLGVEMYRSEYEIDYWLNHFQEYLDTGRFDTNSYWYGYNSVRDADGKMVRDADGKYKDIKLSPVTAMPMELKKKLWSVHSPEHNKYMKDLRDNLDKGMGFKQVPRP